MITLITGVPGSGKTALVVRELLKLEGRQIFQMGIPDFSLPHEVAPPIEQWTELRPSPEDSSIRLPYFTFPEGSILVVDEAQRIYRPRAAGSKVPDIVAALETHRHTGIDIWLITQHPGLIDANIRKLISRHWHIHVTPFGRFLLEWAGIGEPDNKSSRELARRDKYKPDPKVFGFYKSAELHTKVKVRMPWYYYVFFAAVLSALGAAWFVYKSISAKNEAPTPDVVSRIEQGMVPHQPQEQGRVLTSQEYVAQYHERLDGMPHTAPAYDEITKPVTAPEPVGCIAYEDQCKCLTQQGTVYQTTDQLCRHMLKNGPFFMPWKAPQRQESPQRADNSTGTTSATIYAPGKPPEWLSHRLTPSPADNTASAPAQALPKAM